MAAVWYDHSYTTRVPVKKVAFSLSPTLFRAVEAARRRARRSRSAVMQEALRLWIARDREAQRVRQYVAGYTRRPERQGDGRRLEQAGLESWTDLPW